MAPTTAACPCRAWPPTRPAWRSPAARSGQGLPIAIGVALGLKRKQSKSFVYNLFSDGELDEGSTWEAAMSAGSYKLDNLIGIVDVNNMQADGPSTGVLNFEPLVPKFEAFGWLVATGRRQRHRCGGGGLRSRPARGRNAPRRHLRHQAWGRACASSKSASATTSCASSRKSGAGPWTSSTLRGRNDPRQIPAAGAAPGRRAAEDLGHDRVDRRGRPADEARALRPCARRTRQDPSGDRRALGRSREIHRHAYFREGLSGPLLSNGHGRAAADGRLGRPRARRLHALRHHLCGLRVAARL